MQPSGTTASTLKSLKPLAWISACLLSLAVLFAVGGTYLDYFRFDLGSRWLTTAAYTYYLLLWLIFGGAAALCLAMALSSIDPARATRWKTVVTAIPEVPTVILFALLGAVVPLLIRRFVLHGSPLTDDEASYRFAAELLASGRLSIPSPPLKLFFDREFIVNGGTMYSQYFLGWPALMVPGVWLGAPEVMNSIYSALAVPPLYLILRRLTHRRWALVGLVLYSTSLMLMVSAATMMSHTSCLTLSLWTFWLFLRSREDGAWWTDAALALSASVMFFVRPSVGLAFGLPLTLLWAWGLRGRRRSHQLKALLAFAVPAVVMATLFLCANQKQNGSPFTTGYQAAQAYAHANEYRFYGFEPAGKIGEPTPDLPVVSHSLDLSHLLSSLGIAIVRLNTDLFGWPILFLFLPLAGWSAGSRPCWLCLGCFVLLHIALIEPGVDSFGPVHYIELSGPIIFLTVLGLRRIRAILGRVEVALAEKRSREDPSVGAASPAGAPGTPSVPGHLSSVPVALFVSLVLLSLVGYVPFRLLALSRIGSALETPHRLVAETKLHRAVVFRDRPFVPHCASRPTRHWVFWRPQNDPDLKNDILWVNHISVTDDKRLMKHFPGRTGYVMIWRKPCTVALAPLDSLGPNDVPRGWIGGSGKGP